MTNLDDDFVDVWLTKILVKDLKRDLAKGLEQGLDQILERGVERGRERGIMEGKQMMPLRAMTARGLTVTEEIRLIVTGFAGPARLDVLFDRTMTATTIDEVFEGPGFRWSDESDGEAEDAGGVVAQQGLGGEA
jgi:hypothetical protein